MFDGIYDVIVIGVGGMGAATARELAGRGLKVLGLEQFSLGHDRGSSHGQTRIIRKAYYEHPDYVPLLRVAYDLWYDLEQEAGKHLFTTCGCLTVGRPAGEMVMGVLASAEQHHLDVERLAAPELRRRFPAFQIGDDFVGVLEKEAGFLAVEECVRTCIEQARRRGADLREHEVVQSWRADGTGVVVETAGQRFAAQRLVITAGSWAGRLLAERGTPLRVMRQVLLWYGTANDALFRRDRFPCFMVEAEDGNYYGMPMIDANGLKTAQHYGAPELRGPDEVDRTVSSRDEQALRPFLARHLPAVNGPMKRAQVCMYTLTPDRHFILDVHPEHPNVVLGAGFSGHGYKFASVVGKILADLAQRGQTELPTSRFRMGRFAGVVS